MQNFALPLIAIHISGATELFYSVDALAELRGRFGLKHRAPDVGIFWDEDLQLESRFFTGRVSVSEWILRDNDGNVIDSVDLPKPPRTPRLKRRLFERQKARAIELGIAVPLRNRSWTSWYGSYRRNPRIKAENASNRSLRLDARDAGVPAEGLGRARRLGPAPYDDADWRHSQRSWKKHRRTQWKESR
jgi:hypothetical protein